MTTRKPTYGWITTVLTGLLILLAACHTESPYITEGCALQFEADNVLGTQLMICAHPEDDRAYYYYGIMPLAAYNANKLPDKNFMTLVLDSLYRDYMDWRAEYLKAGEEYVAEFRSHTFHYGDSRYYFTGLTPNTDYLVYGFCINPDDIQKPVGKLYTLQVQTTNIDYSVSRTVYDFAVTMYDEPTEFQGKTCLLTTTVRPSENGHLNREPYLSLLVPERVYQNETYHQSMLLYVMAYAKDVQQKLASNNTDTDAVLARDICMMSMQPGELEEGEWVVAIATAYRITWPQALYTRRFQYHRGERLGYGHDEQTDYLQEYYYWQSLGY